MKRFITLVFLFIPIFVFSQNKEKENKKEEDVVISINVSKVNKTLGTVIGFFKSEIKQYKQEFDENLPQETKDNLKEAKKKIKKELKYTRKAIHAGWCQGLRGEDYTPPSRDE